MLEQSKIRKNYAIMLLCLCLCIFTLLLSLLTLESLYESYLSRKNPKLKEINVNCKITEEVQ